MLGASWPGRGRERWRSTGLSSSICGWRISEVGDGSDVLFALHGASDDVAVLGVIPSAFVAVIGLLA